MADQEGVEVDNSVLGKVKITGQNTVLILLCLVAAVAAGFGVYLVTAHEATAKDREMSLVKALEKLTEGQERMVQAQREQNCLIALPQDRREREFTSENSLCKRLSR